jgi:hypothetical protein
MQTLYPPKRYGSHNLVPPPQTSISPAPVYRNVTRARRRKAQHPASQPVSASNNSQWQSFTVDDGPSEPKGPSQSGRVRQLYTVTDAPEQERVEDVNSPSPGAKTLKINIDLLLVRLGAWSSGSTHSLTLCKDTRTLTIVLVFGNDGVAALASIRAPKNERHI